MLERNDSFIVWFNMLGNRLACQRYGVQNDAMLANNCEQI